MQCHHYHIYLYDGIHKYSQTLKHCGYWLGTLFWDFTQKTAAGGSFFFFPSRGRMNTITSWLPAFWKTARRTFAARRSKHCTYICRSQRASGRHWRTDYMNMKTTSRRQCSQLHVIFPETPVFTPSVSTANPGDHFELTAREIVWQQVPRSITGGRIIEYTTIHRSNMKEFWRLADCYLITRPLAFF